MDPTELTKHLPEIAKATTAVAASIPFTAIVKKMLGPAADELAEMWRDQVRLYRYERQLKCVEKAEKMATDAGFTPQAVPPKILFPLLEGASFEENEDLHDMWAALLANAASSMKKTVRPGFISILREMAPDEAELLNSIFDQQGVSSDSTDARNVIKDRNFRLRATFRKIAGENTTSRMARYDACVQMLMTNGLIAPLHEETDTLTLTGLGRTFLVACRPPKPKS
jgi:hypothetical protein